ncbi:MAG: hypothetical protein V4692_12530 [Bdellovibrionota bacterium]
MKASIAIAFFSLALPIFCFAGDGVGNNVVQSKSEFVGSCVIADLAKVKGYIQFCPNQESVLYSQEMLSESSCLDTPKGVQVFKFYFESTRTANANFYIPTATTKSGSENPQHLNGKYLQIISHDSTSPAQGPLWNYWIRMVDTRPVSTIRSSEFCLSLY